MMSEEFIPKISVVIPAYNEEAWIERAVQSVKQQDYPGEFEIIVVDNGSTDKTALIATRCGTRVVYEPKRGPSAARNAGYNAAQGEIIAFMDADSFAPPDWLRSFLKPFLDPKNVVVAGRFLFEGSKYRSHRLFFKIYLEYLGTPIIWFWKILGFHMFSGANFAVRKSALDLANGFDTSVPFWGEDLLFAMNIKKTGRIKSVSYRIYTCARRYNQNGWAKTTATYYINSLWVMLFKRSFNKDFGDLKIPIKEEKPAFSLQP